MKGDLRCIEGRLFRHDPQWDDPDLETDVRECPDCSGDGRGCISTELHHTTPLTRQTPK